MRRARPQPIRDKIDLSDPAQLRAWSKRLGITADNLQRISSEWRFITGRTGSNGGCEQRRMA
jgi:hypothetical protein